MYTQRGDRCQLNSRQRRAIDKMSISRAKSARSSADVDPEYFFNCVTLGTDSSPPSFESPTMHRDSVTPRPESSYQVKITGEQTLKAMELTVLCREYGKLYIV